MRFSAGGEFGGKIGGNIRFFIFENSPFGPPPFAGPEALSSPLKFSLPAAADSGNRGNRLWKSQKIIKVDIPSGKMPAVNPDGTSRTATVSSPGFSLPSFQLHQQTAIGRSVKQEADAPGRDESPCGRVSAGRVESSSATYFVSHGTDATDLFRSDFCAEVTGKGRRKGKNLEARWVRRSLFRTPQTLTPYGRLTASPRQWKKHQLRRSRSLEITKNCVWKTGN